MTTIQDHKNEQGIIAMISVMIITSLILVYGLSAALLNSDEMLAGQARLTGAKTVYLSSSCVQNVFNRLRNNNSLSGTVTIAAVQNVNCSAVISGSGNTRAVDTAATATDPFGADVVSRVNVNVNIATNPFTVLQYKDILD